MNDQTKAVFATQSGVGGAGLGVFLLIGIIVAVSVMSGSSEGAKK